MNNVAEQSPGRDVAVAIAVCNVVGILASVVLVDVMGMGTSDEVRIAASVALVAVHFGLFAAAFGLWQGKSWARRTAIIIGLISLVAFPIGTLVGGFILFKLILRWPSAEFDPSASLRDDCS